MSGRLLLVEDEDDLRRTVRDRLRNEGFDVHEVAHGDLALKVLGKRGFDLVVLDLMLPGRNGLEVLRTIRSAGNRTPVLVLTARGDVEDRVTGLDLGADDYLAKPFRSEELIARIRAILRRTVYARTDTYRFGEIVVDFRTGSVLRAGRSVVLSHREFTLLAYFIEHRGETLSRRRLLSDVWRYHETAHSRTVDVHVAQLRQKLESDRRQPRHLVTVHQEGYVFKGP